MSPSLDRFTDAELDEVRGGATMSIDEQLVEAADDLLTAISCADIDDERVEEKALALASLVATVRRG